MEPGSHEEPHPDRPNVVTMPVERQPSQEAGGKSSPPAPDHGESHDEPGYGHGV